MTLEEVNNKIKFFNEGLDKFISECQLKGKFDKATLTTMSTAIDRIILQDPTVRKILETGTPEERARYTEAIKAGMEQAKKLIEDYAKTADKKDKADIEAISKKSNEKTTGTLSGLEKIDNDDPTTTYSDIERHRDLEDKISKAKKGIVMVDRFDKVKDALKSEGRATTVDEAIKESESVGKSFKKFEKDSESIKELEVVNLPELLKKYNAMSGKVTFDITDKEAQDVLIQISKASRLLTYVDDLDTHDGSLDLTLDMPSDLTDSAKVQDWIEKLNNKVVDPNESKKLDPSLPEYREFLKSRKETIRNEFVAILQASPVHKNLYDGDFSEVAKTDFDEAKMKKFLEGVTEGLKAYKSIEGKDKADLERYIADAEKLLKSYEVTCSSPNVITINGKTRTFSDDIDMTDEGQARDALAEIKALPKEDEFRKEVESEAKALAGVKPTDRWYHKLLSFVTFGRYMTPEYKYFVNLEMKRIEVVSNSMKDKKKQQEEAEERVSYDKEQYKKKAREFVMKNPDKKIDRKKVQTKREKSEPLTR